MLKTSQPIACYSIIEKIGESIHAEVFKVIKKDEPSCLLVLKLIKADIISNELFSDIDKQIRHINSLNIPKVLIPTLHKDAEGSIFLIQEYFDGISLEEWIKHQEIVSLSDCLDICYSIAEILHNIHQADHIYGALKPSNILISPDSMDIRLIDLVRVVDTSKISHFIYDKNFSKSTLRYASPEQTGRIKQRVDFTTDFYSLGIILYELLCGLPPFSSSYPLELIHSHLAEDPIPPYKINPDVPKILSDIVIKLINKEPERRYQTGIGLLHDLEICLQRYNKTGDIAPFILGQKDFTTHMSIPSIMVGRDGEKKILLKEYRESLDSKFKAAFISGLPGIGKTRLIQELQIPIVESHGYFASGKYDQYQKNVPYATLIQAFGNLMRTFLTEDSERIGYRREAILRFIGSNGKLITDLIPELELIIGPQPDIEPLPPAETKIRFYQTMDNFISSLASKDYPLTLFIDDLQWCDSATFDVIENIFNNKDDHPYLFFLGAYRHNEVDEDHPLSHLLQRIKTEHKPLLELCLRRLNSRHCNDMVSYILNSPPSKTKDLSEVINVTSEGNPLYINESISWLHSGDLIDLKEDGTWQWDMNLISKSKMSDATVSLFSEKTKKLPDQTLELIQISACLGINFTAEALSMITGKGIPDLYQELAIAIREDILVRNRDYLSFFHDKIQEAVYNTLDENKRRAIHAHIADAYLKEIPEGSDIESLDNLFEITEHLNKSRESAPNKQTLYRDSKFNFYAGKRAMESLALDAANGYFKQSLELLPEDSWDEDYGFTYLVYKDLAKSELSQGNQVESERLLEILLEKAKTDLDRAECLTEKATVLITLVDNKKTIDLVNQGLEYLGKGIPNDKKELQKKISEYQKKLSDQDIDIGRIAEKPLLTDRAAIIELRLYNLNIPSFYLLGMRLPFVLGVHQAMYLVHAAPGVNDMCTYMIVVYGIQQLFQGRYEQGFEYLDQADKLFERFPDTVGTNRAMSALVWVGEHWRSTMPEVIRKCEKIIEISNNFGDIYRAGQGRVNRIMASLLQCKDLEEIEDFVNKCLEFSERYHNDFSRDIAEGIRAAWIEPMKDVCVSLSFDERVSEWKKSKNLALLGSYYIHKAKANYHLGNYIEADIDLKNYESYHLEGNISHFEWHAYYVLNSLRLYENETDETIRKSLLDKLEPVLDMIETWSRFGPALRPYQALIRAEMKRFIGNSSEAKGLYFEAIDVAHEYEYTLLEGHINSLLGEEFLRSAQSTGSAFILEAVELFKKCHAERNLSLLTEKHPMIIPIKKEKELMKAPVFERLDTLYLLNASRSINQELELDKLLKTIMKFVMERLGAQVGYLFMLKDKDLILRVQGTKSRTLNIELKEEKLCDVEGIGHAILQYVKRTKEPVNLGNASEDRLFKNDREVQELGLRSILCLPILKQQNLLGIIYLQNNLIRSAFTEHNVELTSLLAFQAAISLENAILVEDMKKKEEELTESEHRYRTLFKNVPIGIGLTNLYGKILDINNFASRTLGGTVKEIEGTDVKDYYFDKEDRDFVLNKIKDNGFIIGYESKFKRRDGPTFDGRLSVNLIQWGGEDNFLTIIEDITESKRVEGELKVHRDHLEDLVKKRTALLEVANRELESFSYSVAHDLRAPLRSMDGFSTALLEDYSDKLDDQGIHYLDRIKDSSHKMAILIDDLLELSRVTRMEMSCKNVDLTKVARSIIKDLRMNDPKRSVEVDIEEGLFDIGDPILIKQALVNLFDNSWKFTRANPKAKIEFGAVRIDGENSFYLRDNGIGFDMKYKDKLFLPFQRLHSLPEFPGTGIGLATVQRIINRHGGKISGEAEPEKGATFYLRFGSEEDQGEIKC